MDCRCGFSTSDAPDEAVEEACSPIGSDIPKLILFFCDAESHATYAHLLHKRYPQTLVAGSDTYVLLASCGTAHCGIALTAFIAGISCEGGTIDEIARYPMKYCKRVEKSVQELDADADSCCLLFTPAGKRCEELVLDTLRSALGPHRIPVVGSTAGGATEDTRTHVSLNGQVLDDSSVYVLIHNEGGRIVLFKENIFVPTKNVFTVTDADTSAQIVYELDDMPVIHRLSLALGVPEDEVVSHLPMHPLGRISGDEIFITACDRLVDDEGVMTLSRLYNQTETVLLRLGDYRSIFSQTLARIQETVPHPSFSFVANCVTRSTLFENDGFYSTFRSGLDKYLGCYIGLSGYGEQLGYAHLNHTMVIAMFE